MAACLSSYTTCIRIELLYTITKETECDVKGKYIGNSVREILVAGPNVFGAFSLAGETVGASIRFLNYSDWLRHSCWSIYNRPWHHREAEPSLALQVVVSLLLVATVTYCAPKCTLVFSCGQKQNG